jgi:hypothetical protein
MSIFTVTKYTKPTFYTNVFTKLLHKFALVSLNTLSAISLCKENGPRTIWLNRFWCLMINITCGLMCLLVFVFLVHRMLKLLGPKH